MLREELEHLTGYGLGVSRNHEKARALMRSFGYGPHGGLKIKVLARNIVWDHGPAAILMGLLREIWIDGELGRLKLATGPEADAQRLHGSP
jgi:hypothetical protein